MPDKLPVVDEGGPVPATRIPLSTPPAPVEPASATAAPEETPPKTVEGILKAINFPVERVTALLLEQANQFPDAVVPASVILNTVSAYFGYEHLSAIKIVLGQELLALAKTGKSPVEKFDAELA